MTAAALPVVGLCELGNCPQTVGCGVLRGSARPARAAHVNLGAFYLVGTPVAVGLGFWLGLGFVGLWMGLLAAQVSCAGLMLHAVGTTDWEAQARRAQVLTCTGLPPPESAAVTVVKVEGEEEAAKLVEKEEKEGSKGVICCYEPLVSIKWLGTGSVHARGLLPDVTAATGRGGEDIEWGTKVWVAACVLREGRSSHVYLWKGMAAFGLARDKNSDGSS
ncbi:hypothetical protein C4D60_Mb06t15410 [Musa balbisiana]|uniref:Protein DETOXIFICATION n=1 Tax=Musa balbisiana TaxID=52838 RepID=A0A4S8IPH4_MUSBA|nr:hypothetical protein C4D60_Mb06t15410 [Musa balbisiana]